jgi:ribosome modulation factor
MSDLQVGMMIVQRCRDEGREDARAGKRAVDCPYPAAQELERAGWLDGWSKEKAGK